LHSSKFQTLFYIGTSNFIFPLFLNIALLVHAFRYSDQVVTGSYVLLSSFYVQIIGVLLATVWAAGVQWTEEKFHFTVPTVVLPTMSQSSSGGEISISDRDSDSRMRTHPNDDTKSDTWLGWFKKCLALNVELVRSLSTRPQVANIPLCLVPCNTQQSASGQR